MSAKFYFSGGFAKDAPAVAPAAGKVWEVFKDGVLIADNQNPDIFLLTKYIYDGQPQFNFRLNSNNGGVSTHPLGPGYNVRFNDGTDAVSGNFSLEVSVPYFLPDDLQNNETTAVLQMRPEAWPGIATYRIDIQPRPASGAGEGPTWTPAYTGAVRATVAEITSSTAFGLSN